MNKFVLWWGAGIMAMMGVIVASNEFLAAGLTLMWIGSAVK